MIAQIKSMRKSWTLDFFFCFLPEMFFVVRFFLFIRADGKDSKAD